MPRKYNGLSAKLQKVIDLGLIDNWMRGVSLIVPHAGSRDNTEFNTHMLHHGTSNGVTEQEITAMIGFRHLMSSCARGNVCIDMSALPDGHLRVAFNPAAAFAHSRVFGTSYTNVLPVLFGKKNSPES